MEFGYSGLVSSCSKSVGEHQLPDVTRLPEYQIVAATYIDISYQLSRSTAPLTCRVKSLCYPTMSIACRSRINIATATSKRPYRKFLTHHHVRRALATHSSINNSIKASNSSTTNPPRKQITVLNDDGRVHWTKLTTREKVARATQQSFNAVIVLVGVLATVCTLLVEIRE